MQDLPDVNARMQEWGSFLASPEILFVVPNLDDSTDFRQIWTKIKQGGNYERFTVCYESNLTSRDYSKPMLLFGPIRAFRHWASFDVPIATTESGFQFGPLQFDNPQDRMIYFDPARQKIAYVSNDFHAMDYWGWFGTYQYMIRQNEGVTHLGNLTDGRFDSTKHINLTSIKTTNYYTLQSSFFQVFISRKLQDSSAVFQRYLAALDTFATDFLRKMKLSRPSSPVPAFVHSNLTEIVVLSNFPYMGGTVWGTVQDGVIHSLKFDFGLFRHEGGHFLFNNGVGQPTSDFFNEGVAVYYQHLVDPESRKRALELARKHAAEDLQPWIFKTMSFYGASNEDGLPVSYPIAGLVVEYLVDRGGLEKFKEFYVSADLNASLQKLYGLSLDEFIAQSKQWIQRK